MDGNKFIIKLRDGSLLVKDFGERKLKRGCILMKKMIVKSKSFYGIYGYTMNGNIGVRKRDILINQSIQI